MLMSTDSKPRKLVKTPFGNKYIENPLYRVCCIAEVINLITDGKLESKNFNFLSFTPYLNFCKNWLKQGSELIVAYDTSKLGNKLQPIMYLSSVLKDGYTNNDKYILDQIDHCLGFIGGLEKNRFLLDIDFESHIKNMTQQADTCEVIIPEIKYKPKQILSIQVPLYSDKIIFPNKKSIKDFQSNFDLLLEILPDNVNIINPNAPEEKS